MATAQTKRELFEAEEYVKKMDLMIAKLRTKKPGELTGKVGKNEILTMRREALQQLLKDGYTINQIAEAIKDDVFSILPKTITEIVSNKNKKLRVSKKMIDEVQQSEKVTSTVEKNQVNRTQTSKEKKPGISDAGSISVTADSKDL